MFCYFIIMYIFIDHSFENFKYLNKASKKKGFLFIFIFIIYQFETVLYKALDSVKISDEVEQEGRRASSCRIRRLRRITDESPANCRRVGRL